jgi:hypothetical protein
MSKRRDSGVPADGPEWFKSSYSTDQGGNCVEVAAAVAVRVRDSKVEGGPTLAFGAAEWAAFVAYAAVRH